MLPLKLFEHKLQNLNMLFIIQYNYVLIFFSMQMYNRSLLSNY